MKINVIKMLFTIALAGILQADQPVWTAPDLSKINYPKEWTVGDKVYTHVHVVKIEADCVTILNEDGGALIPIAKLSDELKKTFNYSPKDAAIAAAARKKADDDALQALLKADAEQAQKPVTAPITVAIVTPAQTYDISLDIRKLDSNIVIPQTLHASSLNPGFWDSNRPKAKFLLSCSCTSSQRDWLIQFMHCADLADSNQMLDYIDSVKALKNMPY